MKQTEAVEKVRNWSLEERNQLKIKDETKAFCVSKNLTANEDKAEKKLNENCLEVAKIEKRKVSARVRDPI